MDASYEPDSGYNLTPGCLESDIDGHLGERGPTCAECRHMVECCCDYGVCGLEFDRAFADDGEAYEEPAFVAAWALSWLPTHMRDMQEEACEHFAK